jgi:hypothetical protein
VSPVHVHDLYSFYVHAFRILIRIADGVMAIRIEDMLATRSMDVDCGVLNLLRHIRASQHPGHCISV